MHLIINLIILGAVLMFIGNVFYFCLGLIIMIVSAPISGIRWLVQKLHS